MKLMYIAGPYKADTQEGVSENIKAAEYYAVELMKMGWNVFIPHKHTAHMERYHKIIDCSRATWLERDFPFLEISDALFMLPNWETSCGSWAEWGYAKALGMPIYYKIEEVPNGNSNIS